jgi:hypothetical protein
VKPSAPLERLAHETRHARDVVRRRRLVRRPALAHHVGAQRAVRNLGADVERTRHAREGVHVLRERLPVPAHPCRERRAGDVLDAFHEPDQPLVLVATGGRETHAAVAEHDGRDAAP